MCINGRKLCGFSLSYIYADGVQNAYKSESQLHARDSARWLIGFALKKALLDLFAFTFLRIGLPGT